MQSITTSTTYLASTANEESAAPRIRIELWFLAAIMLVVNSTMLMSGSPEPWTFDAVSIGQGEWWRVATHPFVHVSWYHLFLDGFAFVLLYNELKTPRLSRRLSLILICGIGSLGTALLALPYEFSFGFCGLSGIAHGLMAFTALESMTEARTRNQIDWLGLSMFAAVCAKCIYEAVTGNAFMEFLHFGMMGNPINICHAGGTLAGIAGFWYLSRRIHESDRPACN